MEDVICNLQNNINVYFTIGGLFHVVLLYLARFLHVVYLTVRKSKT